MSAEKIGGLLSVFLWLLMTALYVTGMITLVRDDHRYTTKHLVAGAIIFPYAWYVGGKAIHHYATTSNEHRRIENKCLDYADNQGLTRKSRVFICECVASGTAVEQCNTDYEKQYQANN